MSLREALVMAIELLRDRDDVRSRRACRVLEKKADRMREVRARRAEYHTCPSCKTHRTTRIVCRSCWQLLPWEIRNGEAWEKAESDSALEMEILLWAKKQRA
jgi:ribosomal protein L37AE/L43A